MKKTFKIILIIVAVIIVLWIAGGFIKGAVSPEENAMQFKTEQVRRSDVIRSISATGTVEPEELINVGAQVNGPIMSFGLDADGKPADYGSRVKKGMVLAQIDDKTYRAEHQQAEANYEQGKASILSAEAAIRQAEARLILAKNNWDRAQKLQKQDAISKTDFDTYQSDYFSAEAELSSAKAKLAQAKASLMSAEAQLVKTRRNLEYCTIVSPVDGIVIDRRVSVGQTVVSNQSVSSIFLVAKDFKKMQVWVSVNEADIGSVYPGMPVIFSVDAFPGMEFQGTVKRIRLNATLSSNVVTYIVEVNTDNTSGKLIPYLTANVKFIRAQKKNVLTVATSAFRFNPDPGIMELPAPETDRTKHERILWVRGAEGKLRPVVVKAGLSSGLITEIEEGVLKEDDEIVTGVTVMQGPGKDGSVKNPFLPNMPKPPARGSAGRRQRQQERAAGQK